MFPMPSIPLPPIPGLSPEVHPTFRFIVAIDAVPFSVFTQVVLPTLTMQTEDVKEGGLNTYIHKLPGRVDVSTVKLKSGVAHIDLMLSWYMMVYYGQIAMAKRTAIITMIDSLMIPIMRWTFNDAYPIKWTGPTLDAGAATAAVEEIELAHSGFIVTPI
jgi:phage tail-like protein